MKARFGWILAFVLAVLLASAAHKVVEQDKTLALTVPRANILNRHCHYEVELLQRILHDLPRPEPFHGMAAQLFFAEFITDWHGVRICAPDAMIFHFGDSRADSFMIANTEQALMYMAGNH